LTAEADIVNSNQEKQEFFAGRFPGRSHQHILERLSLLTNFQVSTQSNLEVFLMSIRLYVGNLPKESIERQALQEIFADVGDSVSTKVIKDRKTGKCRGFAFVTVPTDEMADEFIEKYNGQSFMDSPLKIEKALPRAKGKGKEDAETPLHPDSAEEIVPPNNAAGRRNGKKRSRPQNTIGADPQSVQPDPRWAGELAKLKEMLAAAQATNP
jgi:RNA recognition motif-containing protein